MSRSPPASPVAIPTIDHVLDRLVAAEFPRDGASLREHGIDGDPVQPVPNSLRFSNGGSARHAWMKASWVQSSAGAVPVMRKHSP